METDHGFAERRFQSYPASWSSGGPGVGRAGMAVAGVPDASVEGQAGSNDYRVIDHEAIVRRFGPELRRLARQLAGNETDALDLVQDTFERALRKLPTRLAFPSIQSWLRVTLRNHYFDLCRARDRRVQVTLLDAALCAPVELDEGEPSWRRVEPSELWRCVQLLNPLLREVFLLRNRDARSHADIARELSIPISTVGTRCHRAARHLRKMLNGAASGHGELPQPAFPCRNEACSS